MTLELLTVLYGIIIGFALGLTGGGGSIFAVPLLIYGLGAGVREAVGISLAAVGVTSAFGALMRGRSGQVEYKTSLIFALAGILGAPIGISLGKSIPDSYTLFAFAVIMLFVGVKMWRNNKPKENNPPVCKRDSTGSLKWTAPCFLMLFLTGFAVGLFSGIFGVGGGFIIVPALVMVSGMPIHKAVASSLMVISLICLSGVSSYFFSGDAIPVTQTMVFIVGGLIGMLSGSLLAKKLSGAGLKKAFALSIWFVAIYMLLKNFTHLSNQLT